MSCLSEAPVYRTIQCSEIFVRQFCSVMGEREQMGQCLLVACAITPLNSFGVAASEVAVTCACLCCLPVETTSLWQV